MIACRLVAVTIDKANIIQGVSVDDTNNPFMRYTQFAIEKKMNDDYKRNFKHIHKKRTRQTIIRVHKL